MFIPNVVHFTSNIFVKEDEPKKRAENVSKMHFRELEPKKAAKKVSKSQFEHGDPDFVDERTTSHEGKKKESILSSILAWL